MWCFSKNFSKKQQRHKALEDKMVLTESNQALSAEVKRLEQERNHLLTAHLRETQELKEEVKRLKTQKSALVTGLLRSTFKFRNERYTTQREKESLQHRLLDTTAELKAQREEARALKEACVRSVDMNQKYYYMVSSLKEENWTLKEAFVRFADKNQKYSNIVVESLQRAMAALEEERRLKDSTIRDAEQYIQELQTRIQDQDLHLRKEMEENLLCDERDQLQENCQSRIQGALEDTNMDQDQFNQRYMTLGTMDSGLLDEEDTMDSGLLDKVDTMEELEGGTQDLEMDLREEMEENLLCKERNLQRQAESQSRILESLNDANMDLEALNHRMKILGAMNSRLHDDDDEDIEEELQTQDQELCPREEMEENYAEFWAQWDKMMGNQWGRKPELVPPPPCPCCPSCT